jgi:hypothetical protein
MASDHVHSLRVSTLEDLPHLLEAAGLSRGPVLVLVGGAGGLEATDEDRLTSLIREHVLPLVERAGATVVDGGTDAGVMKAMGNARAEACAQFALVGVAAVGTVPEPGDVPEEVARTRVEPQHTHIALVPGDTWGDESAWLSEVASVLSTGHPSVTLLLNGGEIAYTDVRHSLAVGRPVVVVAGSGRTADAIAAAADGAPGEPRAARIAASPLVRVVPLDAPRVVSAALSAALAGTTSAE